MPDFNIRTFDHCPLTAEGCLVHISDDSTNLDGTQIFLSPLDIRFAIPGKRPATIMTAEKMLEKCKGCDQFKIHNPQEALQDVTLHICGEQCKITDVSGILISGSVTQTPV